MSESARKRPVIMLTKDGENIIREFNSIREASIENNIGASNISNCLRGKTNSAGSFKWIYKEKV